MSEAIERLRIEKLVAVEERNHSLTIDTRDLVSVLAELERLRAQVEQEKAFTEAAMQQVNAALDDWAKAQAIVTDLAASDRRTWVRNRGGYTVAECTMCGVRETWNEAARVHSIAHADSCVWRRAVEAT